MHRNSSEKKLAVGLSDFGRVKIEFYCCHNISVYLTYANIDNILSTKQGCGKNCGKKKVFFYLFSLYKNDIQNTQKSNITRYLLIK